MGDSALIEIDAYNNRKFKGIVTKIASSNTTAASAASTSNDVTNYKVHIRILPESYQDLLKTTAAKKFPFRPGMNASADIQTTTKPGVLAASINAVSTREKGTDKIVNGQKDKKEEEGMQEQVKANVGSDLDEVVFVLQPGGTVKKVTVRTGIQDINYIEVLSGLKEGDEVVTAPYNVISKMLKDGMKVQVVPADKLFEQKK
jgi:HlyD family secretion protein